MSLEKLQTMSMQNLRGVKEVHYGIVQVVNKTIQNKETAIQNEGIPTLAGSLETKTKICFQARDLRYSQTYIN